VTNKLVKGVRTEEIYKGSIAFIVIQLVMVGVILFFPNLVIGNLHQDKRIDDSAVNDMLYNIGSEIPSGITPGGNPPSDGGSMNLD
jgi:hypothetical protein